MYNILDAKRHWQNYLTNTKMIPVPSVAALANYVDTKPGAGTVSAVAGKYQKFGTILSLFLLASAYP